MFPRTYQVKENSGARLYFPQQILPNISESCISNINDLLRKLRVVNSTSVSVADPSKLIIDNHDYIVTVDHSLNALVRFSRSYLVKIDSIPIQTTIQMAIAYNNGTYYVKAYTTPMTIIDNTNLRTLNNISLTSVNRARGMIFLNNGQMIVITSYGTYSLVCFNRSNISQINYSYMSNQIVNYSGAYGMWCVNDYSLYSYSNNVNGSWKEELVFKVTNLSASGGVTHVTIDVNNRFWISLEGDTTLIYDQQGNLLSINYTIPNSKIFDIKILDNYVMYFFDCQSNHIIRINPNIQCQ